MEVGHEAELRVAAARGLGELDRVLLELAERLRRCGDAGRGEFLRVVVQPVRVAQQRQRTALALELGVFEHRLGEGRGRVDVRLLQEGREVGEGAGGAELADVVGGEGGHDVGGLVAAGPQRLVDLVVGDVALHLDVDVGVRLLESGDVVVDRLQLVRRGPAVPEGDGDVLAGVVARRGGALAGARAREQGYRGARRHGGCCLRHTGHCSLPPGLRGWARVCGAVGTAGGVPFRWAVRLGVTG